MSAIKHNELFDFDAYNRAMQQVRDASIEFGTSMQAVIDRLNAKQKALTASLKEYHELLKAFNVAQGGASDALGRHHAQVSKLVKENEALRSTKKKLTDLVAIEEASVKRLEQEYRKLVRQFKTLKPSMEDFEKQKARIIQRLEQLGPKLTAANEILRNTKKGVDAAEGSYRRMQQQLDSLNRQLQVLPGAFDKVTGKLNTSNQEAVRLSAAIQQMHERLRNAEQAFRAHVAVIEPAAGSYIKMRAELDTLRTRLQTLPGAFNETTGALNKSNQEAVDLSNRIYQLEDALNEAGMAFKRNKKDVGGAAGSYNAVQRELSELRNRLIRMPGAFDLFTGKLNRSSQEVLELARRIQHLEAWLKRADQSMGKKQNSFGSFGSGAAGAARALTNLAGALIGINSAFEAVSFVVEQNKKFEALEISLRTLTKTDAEFARTQDYLRTTAHNLGLEIFALSENYKKFYASSTIVGYSAETTRELFHSFAKVIANLKLSTEDATGAFLAIEQMMSKGKVSAEELRRQLGNYLPGAFQLAAKAMGVTAGEFDRMLRDGAVMTDVFLPKFAREVENAFGKLDKIDSLQASINRFQNALKTVSRQEGLTHLFTTIIDGASEVLSFFDVTDEYLQSNAESAQAFVAEADKLVATYEELSKKENLSETERQGLATITNELIALFGTEVVEVNKATGAYELQIDRVKELADRKRELATAREDDLIKKLDAAQSEYNATLEDTKVKQQALEGLQNQYGVTVEEARRKQIRLMNAFKETGEVMTPGELKILNLNKQIEKNGEEALETSVLINRYREQLELLGLSAEEVARRIHLMKIGELGREVGNAIRAVYAEKHPEVPPKSGGGGKSAADLEKERLEKFKEGIRKQQEILEKAADLEIKSEELRAIRGEISEEQYRRRKYEIISDYVDAVIRLERRLGGNADAARILDFQEKAKDAEGDYTKWYGEEIQRRIQLAREGGEGIVQAQREAAEKAKKEAREKDFEKAGDFGEKWRRQGEVEVEAAEQAMDIERARRQTSWTEEVQHLERVKALKKRYGLDYAEEQHKIDLMQAERRRELAEQTEQLLWDAAQVGLQALQDSVMAKYDARIQKLEEEKQREMDLAGNNAQAREAIERDYNKRIAKEKEKQARAEKNFALFNVGINTAQAVTKTIALWGMPAALPFIALTVAQGLIQAAAIAAKPIPKFARGTLSAPAGTALWGEEGFELMERNGRMYVSKNEPSLIELQGGERIYSHSESKRIIERAVEAADSGVEKSGVTGRVADEIRRGQKSEQISVLAAALRGGGLSEEAVERAMRAALADMPTPVHNWDERGYTKGQQRRHETNIYLNDRYLG